MLEFLPLVPERAELYYHDEFKYSRFFTRPFCFSTRNHRHFSLHFHPSERESKKSAPAFLLSALAVVVTHFRFPVITIQLRNMSKPLYFVVEFFFTIFFHSTLLSFFCPSCHSSTEPLVQLLEKKERVSFCWQHNKRDEENAKDHPVTQGTWKIIIASSFCCGKQQWRSKSLIW